MPFITRCVLPMSVAKNYFDWKGGSCIRVYLMWSPCSPPIATQLFLWFVRPPNTTATRLIHSKCTECHQTWRHVINLRLKIKTMNWKILVSSLAIQINDSLSAYLHRNAQINYQSLNERENENEEQKLKNFTNAKNINSIKRVQNIIFIRLRRHKKEK